MLSEWNMSLKYSATVYSVQQNKHYEITYVYNTYAGRNKIIHSSNGISVNYFTAMKHKTYVFVLHVHYYMIFFMAHFFQAVRKPYTTIITS